MPDARCSRFSSGRSARRIARSSPLIRPMVAPARTGSPSSTFHSTAQWHARTTAVAYSLPARMPAVRYSMTPKPLSAGETVSSLVMSRSPSSSRARVATRSIVDEGAKSLPLAERHHAIDSPAGACRNFRRNGNVVPVQGERVTYLGQSDSLHEGAHGLRVRRNELLVGGHLLHPVHDSGLRRHDELRSGAFGDLPNHSFSGGDVQPLGVDLPQAHAVDELAGASALGMHQ